MDLFVAKYVTSLMVFVLGLKAPGIITSRDYFNLNQTRDPPLLVCLSCIVEAGNKSKVPDSQAIVMKSMIPI